MIRHFSPCPASCQYSSKHVLQVPFLILSNSITSILQQASVASPIFHPVQQHNLNTAASLCYKTCFSSYPSSSPQYCSKSVLQDPFSILSISITSILQQACVASPIFHHVQQQHLNNAANLRCKSLFSSCPAASPQYCIKTVFQVLFFILSSSITSIL